MPSHTQTTIRYDKLSWGWIERTLRIPGQVDSATRGAFRRRPWAGFEGP